MYKIGAIENDLVALIYLFEGKRATGCLGDILMLSKLTQEERMRSVA